MEDSAELPHDSTLKGSRCRDFLQYQEQGDGDLVIVTTVAEAPYYLSLSNNGRPSRGKVTVGLDCTCGRKLASWERRM